MDNAPSKRTQGTLRPIDVTPDRTLRHEVYGAYLVKRIVSRTSTSVTALVAPSANNYIVLRLRETDIGWSVDPIVTVSPPTHPTSPITQGGPNRV